MDILEVLKDGFLFFDGGMGTLLQKNGLKAGEIPEEWNLTHSEIITSIHKSYFEAGANVATTNTFGANPLKINNVEVIVKKAVENAKRAVTGKRQYVALDIGPTGRLLKPLGDLDFEDAVNAFAVPIKAGSEAGADLIIIETMNDPYELKAAILAAKENSSLPIFATFVLDQNGKTVTGCDIPSMVALLEGLGVSALGVNCSLGAKELKKHIPEIIKYASLPVIVNPNAGMPYVENGETKYNSTPELFGDEMLEIAKMGAVILGGCCGTTPAHINNMTKKLFGLSPKAVEPKNYTVVSSYSKSCFFEKRAILIGERINPTGKSKLKAALRENNLNYIISEAVGQEEKGADMLDVNVGLPEIDEKKMLVQVVRELQAVTTLPLQLDTSSPAALEAAMRAYNGKALVNSVNGKEESMQAVFPLIKKYGGVVIALTLDENGIPDTAEKRVAIAKKIIERAKEYGIDKKDIIVDPLCLTVSSDKYAPSVTLRSIKLLKELGVKTSLGISNVSFGLPMRDYINSTFFANALVIGLEAVIMNPYSVEMMKTYRSYNALMGIDERCEEYIAFAGDNNIETSIKSFENMTLERAIVKGLKSEAKEITKSLLSSLPPLEIVNAHIIPALDKVGADYERGKIFLPQLLMSAETATVAFDEIKESLSGVESTVKGEILLATVKGDIHDIGKNIVKVILENYGYKVHDLGKDVAPESVLEFVERYNIKLMGLSALMTTTVPSMEATIKLVKEKHPETRIMVGGAVLTHEYANMIGADKYGRDAMDAVRYAQEVFG